MMKTYSGEQIYCEINKLKKNISEFDNFIGSLVTDEDEPNLAVMKKIRDKKIKLLSDLLNVKYYLHTGVGSD